jgi:hypothetical protein
MSENIPSTRRGARPLRRRTVAVVAGVAVMLTPLVAAPAAPARGSSVIALLDEMLITGYGAGGDNGPVNGIGPLLTKLLDAISDILKPNQTATLHAKARLRAHH